MTLLPRLDQQTSYTTDTADSDVSSQPEHRTKPPTVLEVPAIAKEHTEAAEMRALRERVEQQLASTATEAPDPGEGTSTWIEAGC
jgi:hypothetical protein